MIGEVAETYRQRPSLFMSGVLQLSSSVFMWNTSFGLTRFRRQRIGARTSLFFGHSRLSSAGPHVLFCPRLDAVSLEKGGHT